MNKSINRLIFFAGWMLSPLTFWNDAFVNIPISYLLAFFMSKFISADFTLLIVISYWLTNIAGLVIIFAAGKRIFGEGSRLKEAISLIATLVFYSAIIVIIQKIVLR